MHAMWNRRRRPTAAARRLFEQAERAIANGGRGIDITHLSSDELIARLRQHQKNGSAHLTEDSAKNWRMQSMNLDQALLKVGDAAANIDFDVELALVIAKEVMPGVEQVDLKRKTKELQIALVQRHLKITHAQLTDYSQGRARVQQRCAPTTHVDATRLSRAQGELSSKQAALEVAKAEFYTAFLSGREGTEADDAYTLAESQVAAAKREVQLAEDQLYQAKRRLQSETDKLSSELRAFDDNNAMIAAFTLYAERLLSEPERVEAASKLFGILAK